MRSWNSQTGLTLTDLLVSMTVFLMVFLVVLSAYTHGTTLSSYSSSLVQLQDGLRVGMGTLERDLRLIGFGLPAGEEIGASTVWTPAIFHASPTELGLRASIEGAGASITCTPSSGNTDCGLTLLRVDSTLRFAELNCEQPDDPGVPLKVVVSTADGSWEPTVCNSVNVSGSSISVATVSDNTFAAGSSDVRSIEQVYYRFTPGAQPPYGYLERYVHYGNRPDDAFPHGSADWTVVTDHLADFWFEYRNAAGDVLTGDPLTAAQRGEVQSIVFLMQGYDRVGPQGKVQIVDLESRVRIRNVGL